MTIRVTTVDLAALNQSPQVQEIEAGGYCVVTAEPRYLAGEQVHANGTIVLTLKIDNSRTVSDSPT
jgi:hypothetical protein